MTPGEKRAEQYERAWGCSKMAETFLRASHGGRESAHVRQAIANLKIALDAANQLEAINMESEK